MKNRSLVVQNVQNLREQASLYLDFLIFHSLTLTLSKWLGRKCTACQRPLHHFCSLDVLAELGLIDDHGVQLDDFPNDTHYCSVSCYNSPQAVECPSQETASAPTPALPITSLPPPKQPKTKNPRGKKKKNSNDSLLGAVVAFSPINEPWMKAKEYKKVGPTVLIGRITKIIQPKNQPQEYEV